MSKDIKNNKQIFFKTFSIEPRTINVGTDPTPPKTPSKMADIPEGTILIVSSGAYSDYCVAGVYRVLKNIDPNLMIRGWLEAHPEQLGRYCFNSYEFREWLEEIGFLEKIPTTEWHLGGYGFEMSVT